MDSVERGEGKGEGEDEIAARFGDGVDDSVV
jgi:hypothetical protein